MTLTELYLINLYAAALSGKPCATAPDGVDFDALFDMALRHGAAPAVYYSAIKEESIPESFKKKLEAVHEKAVYADIRREEEEKNIFAAFEQAEIDYLPLKGSVVRMYYPCTDMRVMGDTDIIINRRDRRTARSIMKDNGFTFEESLSGHDIYKKNDGQVFELHFKPEDESAFHTKLLDRAVKVGDHRLSLTVSDFYIYMISHLARHMRTGGAGLRLFADIKVFCARTASDLDVDYIERTLKSMGLLKFEKGVKSFVSVAFYGAAGDATARAMADYVMEGGVFGNEENHYANKRGDKSRVGYFFSSVFPSYGRMKSRYPFLKYLPFLLPIMWVFRWFALLFKGKDPQKRYQKAANSDPKRMERNKRLFNTLGIKYGKDRMSGGDIALYLIIIAVLVSAIIILGRPFFTETEYKRNHSETVSGEESKETSEEVSSAESSEDVMPERYMGEITYNDCKYKGELKNGVPDGAGTLEYPSGETYVGSFSDGEFNGKGVYTYLDGTKYDGMWFEGEINGQGALYLTDGSYIYGEFIEGHPSGICDYEYPNGDVYKGTLVNWKRNGEGTFIWSNGDKYEGTFVDGERQGYGVYTYCDGGTYAGYWIDNVQNGKGTYTTDEGAFSGIYVEGILEGEGKVEFKNGDKYEGAFVHGIMTDENGKYSFKDGSFYMGSFKQNHFEGKGKLTFRDGSWVEGNFEKGLLQGKATYYNASTGKKRTVTYKNGEPQQ